MISLNQVYLFAHQPEGFDKYGGWTGIKGEVTGCFHTQKIGNRWWIITPAGNVFFATVMSGVRFSGIPETDSEKRPYQETCLRKYSNETTWAETSIKRLKDWGFNTVGNWSSKSVFSFSRLPYLMDVDIGKKAPNVIPQGYYGYFPDVFDPLFAESFRANVEEKIKWYPQLTDDTWLIGYFLADEPSWYGSKQRRGALVDDFIALPENMYGKKAWRDFIAKKYGKIENLNLAWGKNLKSFDELLKLTIIKENKEVITKDKLDFFKFIAEEFSRRTVVILKEYDQHHLILGSRPSRHYPEVVEAVGKYTDIYAMSYGHLNEGYKISPEFDKIIGEIYETTGKPLLLGVLISAVDSGLPYGTVKTQRDRGISYWRYLRKLASSPNIVGLSWFQYFDPPRKCYDERAANWGLVNELDEPYEEAVKLISQANDMIYAYASGTSTFAPEFDGFLSLKKEVALEISQQPLRTQTIPIQNSGFEEGGKGWKLQAWKGKSKASIDSFTKHSGKKALKIEGGPDKGWNSVGVGVQYKPSLALKPDFQYKLSVWIKTKDVENSAFARIKVKYNNGNLAYFATEDVYGTTDWKLVETKFSPNEDSIAEYLGVQLVGRGIAWFDDITLEVIKE
ncbi:MAG: carbohydrate binding domain-containing protein [Candidatus Omnitrophota bacterium]